MAATVKQEFIEPDIPEVEITGEIVEFIVKTTINCHNIIDLDVQSVSNPSAVGSFAVIITRKNFFYFPIIPEPRLNRNAAEEAQQGKSNDKPENSDPKSQTTAKGTQDNLNNSVPPVTIKLEPGLPMPEPPPTESVPPVLTELTEAEKLKRVVERSELNVVLNPFRIVISGTSLTASFQVFGIEKLSETNVIGFDKYQQVWKVSEGILPMLKMLSSYGYYDVCGGILSDEIFFPELGETTPPSLVTRDNPFLRYESSKCSYILPSQQSRTKCKECAKWVTNWVRQRNRKTKRSSNRTDASSRCNLTALTPEALKARYAEVQKDRKALKQRVKDLEKRLRRTQRPNTNGCSSSTSSLNLKEKEKPDKESDIDNPSHSHKKKKKHKRSDNESDIDDPSDTNSSRKKKKHRRSESEADIANDNSNGSMKKKKHKKIEETVNKEAKESIQKPKPIDDFDEVINNPIWNEREDKIEDDFLI